MWLPCRFRDAKPSCSMRLNAPWGQTLTFTSLVFPPVLVIQEVTVNTRIKWNWSFHPYHFYRNILIFSYGFVILDGCMHLESISMGTVQSDYCNYISVIRFVGSGGERRKLPGTCYKLHYIIWVRSTQSLYLLNFCQYFSRRHFIHLTSVKIQNWWTGRRKGEGKGGVKLR